MIYCKNDSIDYKGTLVDLVSESIFITVNLMEKAVEDLENPKEFIDGYIKELSTHLYEIIKENTQLN